ncbi:MAG: tetratricopeptide repeat protein [Gammaproteobacteria bacterium]|nr:tetratricopeptide repeat protein [Gammaproteobacteria bacterium]
MLVNQVDVSFDNVRELLDLSQHKLVIFDFWAEGYEPSAQLTAILATITGEYPEHLVLARVNCSVEQQLAMQFGVRSLPTVLFIKDGQPVDGFAQVESEAQIRQRLAAFLPSPQDLLLSQAQPLLSNSKWAEAVPLLKQVLTLAPERADAKLQLAYCAAKLGQIELAIELTDQIGLADQDALYHEVVALIELAQQAADSPEIRELERQLALAPDNMELQQQLAVQYQAVQRSADALALLYAILQRDLNFGESKKLFLDILAVLPKGDATAGAYRRKLYSLLY